MDMQRTDLMIVELDQEFLKQVALPELTDHVHPLLNFYYDCADVGL